MNLIEDAKKAIKNDAFLEFKEEFKKEFCRKK